MPNDRLEYASGASPGCAKLCHDPRLRLGGRASFEALVKASLLLVAGCLALACDAARPADEPPVGNPFAAATPVDPRDSRFSGRVIERLRAGSYVYLLVERAGQAPAWVVTADVVAPDAERVQVRVVRRVERFESKRLSRIFSPLAFGIVAKDGT